MNPCIETASAYSTTDIVPPPRLHPIETALAYSTTDSVPPPRLHATDIVPLAKTLPSLNSSRVELSHRLRILILHTHVELA